MSDAWGFGTVVAIEGDTLAVSTPDGPRALLRSRAVVARRHAEDVPALALGCVVNFALADLAGPPLRCPACDYGDDHFDTAGSGLACGRCLATIRVGPA